MAYTAAGEGAKYVDNVERVVLEQLEDKKPDMVRDLFTEMPWNPGDGDKVTFNSIALSGFAPRVDENESYPTTNPSNGNELSKTQIQYGDKLEISRRMVKFNRYQQSRFDAEDLASRIRNTLDLELTLQVFSEADQTTFTPAGKSAYNIATSDGQALASASHSYGGVSFSNLLSGGGALSQSNLNAAIEQGQQETPDDFGTYLTPNYDTLVISDNVYMKNKAFQLFGSPLTPESGNNAVNFYNTESGMKIISLKFGNRNTLGAATTDNIYRWMIMDSNMARRSLQLQLAEAPTTEQQFVDHDNLVAKILVTQFAAYAAVKTQGMVYSLSTTAPTIS